MVLKQQLRACNMLFSVTEIPTSKEDYKESKSMIGHVY
jgi:hypothetical protein